MRKKTRKIFSHHERSTVFAVSFALLAFSFPVHAEDIDPFQLDTAHWASFDHYLDKVKRGHDMPADTAKNDDTAQISLPTVAPPASNAATPVPDANVPKPNATPVMATPSRPLELPVMPGVNKGYQVRVNSTEDEAARPVAQITNMDSAPTLQLPKHNWQDAAEAAQHNAQNSKDADDGDAASKPLHIRMSFLPNLQVKPQPPQPPPSNHGRAVAAAVAMSTPVPETPKKSPAELAACAALDAYKKQQLEAIQSDRQTLTALQNAIAKLGLQKQLSFMAGAQGSVGAQAENAPVNMDMPVTSHP